MGYRPFGEDDADDDPVLDVVASGSTLEYAAPGGPSVQVSYSGVSESGQQIQIAPPPPPPAAHSIAPRPLPAQAAGLQAAPKQPVAGVRPPFARPPVHLLGGAPIPLRRLDGTEHLDESTRAVKPVKYVYGQRRAKYVVTVDSTMMRNGA